MKIPNFIETETEYYTIQYWIDKTSMGKHIETPIKPQNAPLKSSNICLIRENINLSWLEKKQFINVMNILNCQLQPRLDY